MHRGWIAVAVPALLLLGAAGSLTCGKFIQPPACGGLSMVLDRANQRMILYGGHDGRAPLDDVWQLSFRPFAGLNWRPLRLTGVRPDGRYRHEAVYDPVGKRMIVFAGMLRGGPCNEVWTLDLTPGRERWELL